LKALAGGHAIQQAALGNWKRNKDLLIPVVPDNVTVAPQPRNRARGGCGSISSSDDLETPTSSVARGGKNRLKGEEEGMSCFTNKHFEMQEKRDAMDKERFEEEKREKAAAREANKRKLELEAQHQIDEKEERDRQFLLQQQQLELQKEQQKANIEQQKAMMEFMNTVLKNNIGK